MANILEDVQNYVVGKLSGDYILSACPFLAENRKDIDYEIKNRLGKQGIVGLVMTPKATYAGKFEDLFLSWTLEELEIDIVENVTVNRGKRNGFVTGQDAAMRLFDVLCPLSGDFEGQFNPVSYEEGEDGNLIVNKCVLKALVYGEHGDVPQPEKPITYQFVKLLDQPPPLSVQPHDGWMWQDADGLYFYVDHVAHKLGDVSSEQLSTYVESQVSSKVEISAFNELQNSLSDYYTKSETSSSSEISTALGSKQDNLTPLQLLALSAEIDENKTMLVGGYSNGEYFPVYVDWYGEVTQEMVSDAINQIDERWRFNIGVRLGTAVSAIGVSAFANAAVSEVYAPQNVVQVKDYAFANSDLQRIKFDYSDGRYTPIVIGDYAFQSCSSLVLADIPVDHDINIGVSAFDGCPFTTQNESLYPYDYGLYFNRSNTHSPEVTPGAMPLFPNYPWGLSSTSAIKFGTTASRYWVECQHYGKDTLYATGRIRQTVSRPRTFWLDVDDNTNTTFTLKTTATTQVRIQPTNRTAGKMYNAYLALSADEGITRPFVWYTLSGSYTFDKFQDEYIQNNPIESGKINYYHIYEYQPDHFAVEKLGWTEEQLSAKADVSALNAVESSLSDYALTSQIPLSVSQLENDSGYLTAHQPLSDYYTKSETSSNVEIQNALDGKQPTGDYALTSQLPTKVSQLSNDSGYITSADVPTKTSELTNDSDFITSAQVVPSTSYGMNGYAANSEYATRLNALDIGTALHTNRGLILPTLNYDSATNTYTLELYGSVGGYYPWNLHRLFGTDFSPAITLEWRKGTIYRKRIIGGTVRWSQVYNNWMWVAKGQYAITCPTGDGKPDGKFYVLNYEDETHPNYINDPATDVHTITYNNNNITSIDGQAGGQTSQTIWCTRTNDIQITIWERPFAYRDELSAKADLSALNAVESSLSDYALVSQIPLSVSQLENDSGYLSEHQSLSDYYTKSETSSKYEISAALNLKQDKLSDAQISAIDTPCLPLNLRGNNAISGNHYLDFYCLPRFFRHVAVNGALDVTQLNVFNYDVDSYIALSAMDEDTLGFVGGFNREYIAVLNLKNGTIAYVSDIEQAVSSKADLSALALYREKSDLHYEHSFSKANWQDVPRFVVDSGGTRTVLDQFDAALGRWTASDGTSRWYVEESEGGMDMDPQFILMESGTGMGMAGIMPAEGAGTLSVDFSYMGVDGTFTMDMSDQLVCKSYVDRRHLALEARLSALEAQVVELSAMLQNQ